MTNKPEIGQLVLFKHDMEFGIIIEVLEVNNENIVSLRDKGNYWNTELGTCISILWEEKLYNNKDFVTTHPYTERCFVVCDNTEKNRLALTLKYIN